MGIDAAFSSDVLVSTPQLLGNADTSNTAPVNYKTIATADPVGKGLHIYEILVQAVATTAAGLINVFLHDGTTFHLVDQIVINAWTQGATVKAYRKSAFYDQLFVPAGWTLRVSMTAGTANTLKVTPFGGAF